MASRNGVPMALRRRVFREEGYTCAGCGLSGCELRRPAGPLRRRAGYTYPTPVKGVWLSIDHVVPRARGGSSERSNLRVLCTTCNTRKGTKDAA
jgi:5-methylcytosine-specific restriction endonuclease McrA